jgi:hypothetical protein
MTTQAQTIAELEQRASKVGTKLYKVAIQADISPSTFYRWKTGSKASLENVLAIVGRLEVLELLQRQRNGEKA